METLTFEITYWWYGFGCGVCVGWMVLFAAAGILARRKRSKDE